MNKKLVNPFEVLDRTLSDPATTIKVRRQLRQYFDEGHLHLGIQFVEARIDTNVLSIMVCLQRPGLFIGKGGRDFHKVKKWIEKVNPGLEVKIQINEYNPLWENQIPKV